METRLRKEMPRPCEQEVEDLLGRLVDAIGRKDLSAVMACYSDEVVAFDLMPPLRHVGAAAFRELWRQAFDMPGPFALERHDLTIEAGDDVAFAYALDHARFQEADGSPGEVWMRWTGCLRRLPQGWRIVHEQSSVPVDMESGRALTTLRP